MAHIGRLLAIAALILATLLPAAAGDFGRPSRSVLEDLIPRQFWKGPVTGYSSYPLTDLEEELRDRAYALIRPNEPRGRWNLILLEFHIAQVLPPSATSFDVTAYGRMILWTPGRSEASQYQRFIDDVIADTQLVGPFVVIACKVADMDAKRERSLQFVTAAQPDEVENAVGRVRENKMTTAWVRQAMFDRIASYRYALERLVIAVPSKLAIDAERALVKFTSRVAELDPTLSACCQGLDVIVAPYKARPLVTK
jgi:hypothetical protein